MKLGRLFLVSLVPAWTDWPARPYQRRAVQFLLDHPRGCLFLDPGLGKTSIVLDAFMRLKKSGRARRALIVAPLRVCYLVWPAEIKKWRNFRGLKITVVHGPHKADRLKEDSDILVINPEGINWLVPYLKKKNINLNCDIIVFDELTKFKNSRAKRSKLIRKILNQFKWRWGLTGTPTPNGYMDLFGQMLVIDDGETLGRYFTQFVNRFCLPDPFGFGYHLRPGAEKEIETAIKNSVLRMSAEDYLDLPPVVNDIRLVRLEPSILSKYTEFKKKAVLHLDGDVITAANAGVIYNKLRQFANGAIYNETGFWKEIHQSKIEALEELVEELSGQQLLIAYEFKHDFYRIRNRFGDEVAHISAKMSREEMEILIDGWNSGKIKMMAVHPASAGHGLNLQGSSCAHIVWMGMTLNYEHYEQTLRRIWRQGTLAQRIVNHVLVAKDTIDERVLALIDRKKSVQQAFLAALAEELGELVTKTGDSKMALKLKRRSEVMSEAEEVEEAVEASEAVEEEDEQLQRKKINKRLRAVVEEPDDDEEEEEDEEVAAVVRQSIKRRIRAAEVEADDDQEAEKPVKKASVKRKPSAKPKAAAEPSKPAQGAITASASDIAKEVVRELIRTLAKAL